MKYFTAQRYVDFNSDVQSSADAAAQEWEKAIAGYRKHIHGIRSRLPPRARDFIENMCLHDGSYLGFLKVPLPRSAGELAVVAVELCEQIALLLYVLVDEPSLSSRHAAEVFSEEQVHWLYDEFDVLGASSCLHEILLSNGRVLSIPFMTFDLLTVQKHEFEQVRNGVAVVTAS